MKQKLRDGDVVDAEIVESPTPEHEENELLGDRLTPEGWRQVRWIAGKKQVMPVDPIPIAPLHRKFREKHRKALNIIFGAIDELKTVGREFPLLRVEIAEKLNVEKNLVKDLEEFGLLQQEMLQVSDKEKGKKMGGRIAVVPTLQGYSLMKTLEQVVQSTSA